MFCFIATAAYLVLLAVVVIKRMEVKQIEEGQSTNIPQIPRLNSEFQDNQGYQEKLCLENPEKKCC